METTVGAFNCEYRAVGGGTVPGPVELEHDLRTHLAPAVADGLDLALAGDPTVYAIRRLDCDVTLRGDGRGLPDLARRTGGAVTNAILRALSERTVTGAAGAGTSTEVMTFADEAEFLAQFVIDVLEDRAHGPWYYASFRDALALSRPEALASVLPSRDPVTAWRALGRICSRGYLERLLGELPMPAQARLGGMGVAPADDSLRPMLTAALALLRGVIEPTVDREQLFRRYVDTVPPVPDWRDRRSLAEGVIDAVSFVLRATRVKLDSDASARVRTAATALDWLDTATLLVGIERLTAEATAAAIGEPSIPARSWHVPVRLSARQRLILRDLAAACRSGRPGLDVQRGDCAANRLRLRAALTAHDERWADDPVAAELIGALLSELARGAGGEGPLLRELSTFGVTLAEPSTAAVRLARPGSIVSDGVPEAQPEDAGIYSDVAGVALLLRAALDIRLATLASTAEFLPGRGALVAALLALAGTMADEPDPALSVILEADMPPAALPDEDSPRHAFEANLLRALAARDLLAGDPVAVATEIGGVPALVGGIGQPALWPLIEIVRDSGEAEATVMRWREAWSNATGQPEPGFQRVSDDTGVALALSPLIGARRIGSPAELSMVAAGLSLVRVWGWWLPGVGRSSLRYLLDHFIHRPGTVSRDGDAVRVMLERRELDAVLELSGLLAPIDARRSLGVVLHFDLSAR